MGLRLDSVALLEGHQLQEMAMFELTDQAFTGLQPLLPANSRRGKPWRDHRQVLGGILWKLHTGRPWRDMPGRFGPWQTCYSRLRRWQQDGTWPRIWAVLAGGDRSGHGRCGQPSQALLAAAPRSEEHTSELQSRENLVCRLLLEK